MRPLALFTGLLSVSLLFACGDGSGAGDAGDASADVGADATSDSPLETNATLTVNGRVVDAFGAPKAFLPISVGGLVNGTDANGNFSIGGVSAPYDINIVDPVARVAFVYKSITRSNPVITLEPPQPTLQSYNISVSTSGSAVTNGAYNFVQWVMPGIESLSNNVTVSADSFNPLAYWYGPPSLAAHLYVLQLESGGTGFRAFGISSSLQFQNGGSGSTSIALKTVTTTSVSATITSPPNFSIQFVAAGLYDKSVTPYSSGLLFPYARQQGTNLPAAENFVLPAGTSLDTYITVVASNGTNYSMATVMNPTTPLTIDIPAPVNGTTPVNNSVGVPVDASLEWSAVAGSSYLIYLAPKIGPLQAIYVVTTSTSTQIPDLTGMGYPMPHGVTCQWQIRSLAPTTSIDEFVDANQGSLVRSSENFPNVSTSDTKTFTLVQ